MEESLFFICAYAWSEVVLNSLVLLVEYTQTHIRKYWWMCIKGSNSEFFLSLVSLFVSLPVLMVLHLLTLTAMQSFFTLPASQLNRIMIYLKLSIIAIRHRWSHRCYMLINVYWWVQITKYSHCDAAEFSINLPDLIWPQKELAGRNWSIHCLFIISL